MNFLKRYGKIFDDIWQVTIHEVTKRQNTVASTGIFGVPHHCGDVT